MGITRREQLAMLAASPFALAATEGGLAYPGITVFEAARIVTMEPSNPSARFVAVADGIILGTANTLAELEPWTRGRTVQIDRRFAKDVLMPGLIDPHVHPMLAAVALNMPYLAPDDWKLPSGFYPGVQTQPAYRQKLAEMLAGSKADPFLCWGYHELFHGPLDRAVLDQMSPDRPVIIWQRSFHDIIVNTAMMKRWGFETQAQLDVAIAAAKANPEHIDFAKAHFSETGTNVALAKMRPLILTPEKIQQGMAALKQMMLTSGVTTVSDMGIGVFASAEMEAGLIKAAFEQSRNPSRVLLMPSAGKLNAVTDLDGWMANFTKTYASHHVRIDRRVKMLADGAFFGLNMRMNAPGYLDGHIGKWLTEPQYLRAEFTRFWAAGFSLHIHVNGDEGLDVVLGHLAELPRRANQTITLEHLGYSTEAQNRRIAQMGLMVSAQPNYIRVLGDVYEREGLGPDRAAQMNRLGSLERKGVPLGLHSDFNMAPIDPLYLAWVAANRITIGGKVKAPNERLSLGKALRAVTIEAAQVIGMDALVGSIAAGKKADFTVLDRDPYSVGAARLRELKVKGVIFEGAFTASGG
ncbi:MAG: amidohydrolase family protein [Novosphingobium sp.]|uniref:amidohydrolase n=1 Tax=Novosphingobium sp. TaxID=1874826 RepID=UPI0032BEB708